MQIEPEGLVIAVFAGLGVSAEPALVNFEALSIDNLRAEAKSRGQVFAGYVVASAVDPHVHIEAGFAATMVSAGPAMAELLGASLQAKQLEESARASCTETNL